MNKENIYQENGFKDRKEYLHYLADQFGLPIDKVCAIADIFGAREDFDGLITGLEDYFLIFV